MKSLPIGKIRRDGGTQVRAQTDWLVVDEYVNAMRSGAVFPPVVVFFDGEDHWLADGFHRIEAAERASVTEVSADVRSGGRRDALLFACGANAAHGLRRTKSDIRRAIETLLTDGVWSEWNDSQIARACLVDHKTVASIRSILGISQDKRKVTRNGTTYTQNTANIGKRAEPTPAPAPLPAWVEESAAPPVKPAQDVQNVHAVQNTLNDAAVAFTCPRCGSHRYDAGGSGDSDYVICSDCGWFEEESGDTDDWKLNGGTTSVLDDVDGDPVECDPPTIENGQPAYAVRVINGDAQRVSELVADPVHLVITSPPYNVGIEYDQHNDSLTTYIPMLLNVWRGCHRVMENGARIAVVVPFGVGRNPYVPFDCQIIQTLVDAGFTIRGRIIWDKNTTGNRTSWGSFRLPSSPAIRDTTECVIVAHKGSDSLAVPDDAKRRDDKGVHTDWLQDSDYFMSLAQDHWVVAPESAQRVKHPAPFPVELVTRLIHFYAFPGAHILDPFGGSGTVGVAAKQHGCQATLIELSAEYCALAQGRIA